MKKITLFILGLLLLYGCAGASEPVANPAEEAMNASLFRRQTII